MGQSEILPADRTINRESLTVATVKDDVNRISCSGNFTEIGGGRRVHIMQEICNFSVDFIVKVDDSERKQTLKSSNIVEIATLIYSFFNDFEKFCDMIKFTSTSGLISAHGISSLRGSFNADSNQAVRIDVY